MRAPTLAVLVGLLVGSLGVSLRDPDTSVRASLDAPRSFEIADAPWQQQIGPLFGSAAILSPSGQLLRGVRALGIGARESRVNAAAALLMGISAGLVTWLAWRLTLSQVIAAGVGLAMAAGPNMWPRATTAEATLRPLFDTVLALSVCVAAVRWRDDGRRAHAGVAVVAGALALADNLALLAGLPPFLLLWRRLRPTPVTRPLAPTLQATRVAATVGVLVVSVCAWHVVASNLVWSAQPELVRSVVPRPTALELVQGSWRWPLLPDAGPHAVVAARLADVAGRWLGDLRMLGTALSAMGLVGGFVARPKDAAAVACGLVLMALGGVVPGTSPLGDSWPPLAAGAWLVAALGLARLRDWGGAPGAVAAALLAGLLPLLNLGATLMAVPSGPMHAAPRAMDVDAAEFDGPMVFIAGSPSVARVTELAWARPGVARIPFERSIIETAAASRPLLTAGDANQRLELLGGRTGEVTTSLAVATSSLHRLEACVSVGDTWVDVTETVRTGRVGLHPSANTSLTLYVAHDRPLRFRLGAFPGWPDPQLEVSAWDTNDATHRARLEESARVDGVTVHSRPSGTTRVYRVAIRTGQGEATTLALAVGGLPRWAVARSTPRVESAVGSPRAMACAGPGGVDVGTLGPGGTETTIALDHRDAFGDGWHDVERVGRERFRWTSGLESEMLWRFESPVDVEVTVVATPSAPSPMVQTIGLVVDGASFGEQPLTPQEPSHVWVVPASAWRVGVTPVGLTTSSAATPPPDSGDRRQLGVRVSRIVVRRSASKGR